MNSQCFYFVLWRGEYATPLFPTCFLDVQVLSWSFKYCLPVCSPWEEVPYLWDV
jgi:hypothetical protein